MNDAEWFLDSDNEIARWHEACIDDLEDMEKHGVGVPDDNEHSVLIPAGDYRDFVYFAKRAHRDRAELLERGRRVAQELARLRSYMDRVPEWIFMGQRDDGARIDECSVCKTRMYTLYGRILDNTQKHETWCPKREARDEAE